MPLDYYRKPRLRHNSAKEVAAEAETEAGTETAAVGTTNSAMQEAEITEAMMTTSLQRRRLGLSIATPPIPRLTIALPSPISRNVTELQPQLYATLATSILKSMLFMVGRLPCIWNQMTRLFPSAATASNQQASTVSKPRSRVHSGPRQDTLSISEAVTMMDGLTRDLIGVIQLYLQQSDSPASSIAIAIVHGPSLLSLRSVDIAHFPVSLPAVDDETMMGYTEEQSTQWIQNCERMLMRKLITADADWWGSASQLNKNSTAGSYRIAIRAPVSLISQVQPGSWISKPGLHLDYIRRRSKLRIMDIVWTDSSQTPLDDDDTFAWYLHSSSFTRVKPV